MERFELSTVINRPTAEVFAVLSDLENDLKWRNEWVDARKTSEGPIGMGTRFSLFAKAFGQRIETIYGYLVIADISGYTSSVAKTELEHAHKKLTTQ